MWLLKALFAGKLISLLAGLAGWSALAKDIPFRDLIVILDAGVTVETNAESSWLEVSWGRPDSHWSPLYLEPCLAAQSLGKTNVAKTHVQTQSAQWTAHCALQPLQEQLDLQTKRLDRLSRAIGPRLEEMEECAADIQAPGI